MSRSSGSHHVRLTPDEQLIPTFIRGLPMAREALAYARELHRGQRRASDEAPFILHPLEVASLLYNAGYSEPVVAVGILHDTLEARLCFRTISRSVSARKWLGWWR